MSSSASNVLLQQPQVGERHHHKNKKDSKKKKKDKKEKKKHSKKHHHHHTSASNDDRQDERHERLANALALFLRELLTNQREMESNKHLLQNMLVALDEGGGVSTEEINNDEIKDSLELLLVQFGCEKLEHVWAKKINDIFQLTSLIPIVLAMTSSTAIPSRRAMMVGPALPPPQPASSSSSSSTSDGESNGDDGPLPSNNPLARKPQDGNRLQPYTTTTSTTIDPSSSTNTTQQQQREAWMMEMLPEDSSKSLYRHSMTSQRGRSFQQSTSSAATLEYATPGESGAPRQPIPVSGKASSSTDAEFRWNYEEMMATERFDPKKTAAILDEEGMAKRFKSSSR